MTTTPEPTLGVPRIEGDTPPTFRADHNALADWVRDNTYARQVETLDDRNTLPEIPGLTCRVEENDSVWMFTNDGWVFLREDTGWITATLYPGSSYTHRAGNPSQYRRLNGVVYGRGELNVPGGGGGVFYLPAGLQTGENSSTFVGYQRIYPGSGRFSPSVVQYGGEFFIDGWTPNSNDYMTTVFQFPAGG